MKSSFLRRKFTSLLLKCIDVAMIERKLNRIKSTNIRKFVQADSDVFFRAETASVVNPQNDASKIIIKGPGIIDGELHIFKYGGSIFIDEGSYVGKGSRVWSGEKVVIGKYVLISHNVGISDTTAHEFDYKERAERYIDLMNNGYPENKAGVKTAPIIIEDYAWINFNSIILKGVTIGKGAIVAAGSVVTKNVPAWTLVAGNPARVVKQLDRKE